MQKFHGSLAFLASALRVAADALAGSDIRLALGATGVAIEHAGEALAQLPVPQDRAIQEV